MTWYYANGGQQQGPVTEAEFAALVKSGVIGPATLVWNEGMSNWAPYQVTVQSASIAPPVIGAASAGSVVCAECRQWFAQDEVIEMSGRYVCARCKPLFLQKLQEGVVSPAAGYLATMVYAKFWERALAKIIDYLILQAVNMAIFVPIMLFAAVPRTGANPFVMLPIQIGANVLSTVLSMAYTVYFLHKYAATPGKLLFKIMVVRSDGSPLSLGRCFGRFFAEWLSAFTCCIGYLLPVFDNHRRTLHDHICDTRVVQKPPTRP
jgi:uncharacterized RDD family membrane protein YckC